ALSFAQASDRATPLPAAQAETPYMVQLGFPVRAGDVYPFTFTYANLPDWLKSVSKTDLERGIIGGTPGKDQIQDRPVIFEATVRNDAGKKIATFPFLIVEKATPSPLVVMAGTRGGSPTPPVSGSSQSSSDEEKIGPPPAPTPPTKLKGTASKSSA